MPLWGEVSESVGLIGTLPPNFAVIHQAALVQGSDREKSRNHKLLSDERGWINLEPATFNLQNTSQFNLL